MSFYREYFGLPLGLKTYPNQDLIINIALYICDLNALCFFHQIEWLLLCPITHIHIQITLIDYSVVRLREMLQIMNGK